jgi:uncharacterized membrane protein HdeD (DUF308 family)
MRIIYSSSFKRSFTMAVVAIALGVVLVAWPGRVLDYMVKVIGATFCVVGIVSLLLSSRERSRSGGMFPASGVGSIVLGVVLWLMSGLFTDVLIYLLGFMLLVAGVGQLALLVMARRVARVPAISYFFPLVTLAVGVLVLANPFEAKETIVMVFGVTSIFWGVSQLVNHYAIKTSRPARADEPETVDTDYEEV